MLSECNVRNGGMAQMLHDAEARLESIDDLAYINRVSCAISGGILREN